jgi:hypothetical protein
MRRLAGVRVFHPTAVHMRSIYEEVMRVCAFSMGAMRFLIF